MNKFVRSFAAIIAIANSTTPNGLVALALGIAFFLLSILAIVVMRTI